MNKTGTMSKLRQVEKILSVALENSVRNVPDFGSLSIKVVIHDGEVQRTETTVSRSEKVVR